MRRLNIVWVFGLSEGEIVVLGVAEFVPAVDTRQAPLLLIPPADFEVETEQLLQRVDPLVDGRWLDDSPFTVAVSSVRGQNHSAAHASMTRRSRWYAPFRLPSVFSICLAGDGLRLTAGSRPHRRMSAGPRFRRSAVDAA